jgi:hypothetical protein
MVEHFVRQGDGSWNLRLLRKGDRLVIYSLRCELGVEEMYRKVFEGGAGG